MPLPRNVKILLDLGRKPRRDGKESEVIGWTHYNGQLFFRNKSELVQNFLNGKPQVYLFGSKWIKIDFPELEGLFFFFFTPGL